MVLKGLVRVLVNVQGEEHMNQEPCPACNDKIEVNGEICEACCSHSDHTFYCCLICGKERE